MTDILNLRGLKVCLIVLMLITILTLVYSGREKRLQYYVSVTDYALSDFEKLIDERPSELQNVTLVYSETTGHWIMASRDGDVASEFKRLNIAKNYLEEWGELISNSYHQGKSAEMELTHWYPACMLHERKSRNYFSEFKKIVGDFFEKLET